MLMVAIRLGKDGNLTDEQVVEYMTALQSVPDLMQNLLTTCTPQLQEVAKVFRLASNFLYLGRGYNFPVALEGALKLKEISYIHAEGYPAAEMKHGPIALIDQFMPVVVIAPRNDPTYLKVKANIEEVHARNGSLIIITDEGNTELDRFSEYVLQVPVVQEWLQPIVNVVPLQLL